MLLFTLACAANPDAGISKACVQQKNAILAKAKAYETNLEEVSGVLFQDACQESVHKYHSCVATLNWNKYSSKLHQYSEVVESIDKGGEVCFVDFHFNMKVGDSGNYHYDIKLGDVVPVGSACTADDRVAILKDYKENLLLNGTLHKIPDAHVEGLEAVWDSKSCATPPGCQGKADLNCYSSSGYCLGGLDRVCPKGTSCSEAFHKKFPTKDPCIFSSDTYGCNKETKQCVKSAGYQNHTECVGDTTCTH